MATLDPFVALSWCAQWIERMAHHLVGREFANGIAIWGDKRWIGNGWCSSRCRVAVIWNNTPSCWYASPSGCSSPFPGQTNCLFPAARNSFTKGSFRPKSRSRVRRPISFRGGVCLRSLVTVGFVSSPASLALLIDMVVATATTAVKTLPKRLSPLRRLDDLLYLPEVLYACFFIWLICSGPGKFSVDYWLASKLLG